MGVWKVSVPHFIDIPGLPNASLTTIVNSASSPAVHALMPAPSSEHLGAEAMPGITSTSTTGSLPPFTDTCKEAQSRN